MIKLGFQSLLGTLFLFEPTLSYPDGEVQQLLLYWPPAETNGWSAMFCPGCLFVMLVLSTVHKLQR